MQLQLQSSFRTHITSQNSPSPLSVIAKGASFTRAWGPLVCRLTIKLLNTSFGYYHTTWTLSCTISSNVTHCFFFLFKFHLAVTYIPHSLCFYAHTVLQCMDRLHSICLPTYQWVFGFTLEAIMINLAMNICAHSIIKLHDFSYLSRIPKSRIIGENAVCIFFFKSCHSFPKLCLCFIF